jgi:hypothetical protein
MCDVGSVMLLSLCLDSHRNSGQQHKTCTWESKQICTVSPELMEPLLPLQAREAAITEERRRGAAVIERQLVKRKIAAQQEQERREQVRITFSGRHAEPEIRDGCTQAQHRVLSASGPLI